MAKDDTKAAFSMSIETLKRINTLLWYANTYQSYENYYSWYNVLLNLWKEVTGAVKLTDQQISKIDKKIQNTDLKKLLGCKELRGVNRINLFNRLYDIEKEIRTIMREKDLTMIKKGDAGAAITYT